MRLIDADSLKLAFIGKRYGTQAIEYVIDQQPTVDAIPKELHINLAKMLQKLQEEYIKQGHWNKSDHYYCSECNGVVYDMPTMMGVPLYDYCPFCGAKMDEVEDAKEE